MTAEQLDHIAHNTRLYARSKGLTLIGQGICFTVGVLPLLHTLRLVQHSSPAAAAGMYAASSAVFLFLVWVGLKLVPGVVDRAYYRLIGNVVAAPPDTPDWGRLIAPVCLLGPIGAAGVGVLDAWQATVIAMSAFGLYMFAMGKFRLHEPATEIIGATAVLLSGLVAAVPEFASYGGPAPTSAQIGYLLQAQYAAVATVGWLGMGWVLSAIALHAYNRWLLAEIGRDANGGCDDGQGS